MAQAVHVISPFVLVVDADFDYAEYIDHATQSDASSDVHKHDTDHFKTDGYIT